MNQAPIRQMARGAFSKVLAVRKTRAGAVVTSVVAVVVLVGAYLSARDLGVDPSHLLHWQVLVATGLSGILILLNAMEYRLTADLAGVKVPIGSAVGVAVLAGIANLLPLPGGVMVRLERLNVEGVRLTSALRSNAFVGGVWVSLAAILAAILLWYYGEPTPALTAVALGVGLVVLSVVLLRQPFPVWGPSLGRAVAIESMFLILATVRIDLTAQGLGLNLDAGQSALLAVTSVLATTVGIVPGGWGIWEAISVAMAPLVGLEPAAALLTSATVRVQNVIGLGVGLGFIASRRRATTSLKPERRHKPTDS